VLTTPLDSPRPSSLFLIHETAVDVINSVRCSIARQVHKIYGHLSCLRLLSEAVEKVFLRSNTYGLYIVLFAVIRSVYINPLYTCHGIARDSWLQDATRLSRNGPLSFILTHHGVQPPALRIRLHCAEHCLSIEISTMTFISSVLSWFSR
jgi:hypothetical protein